MTQFEQAVFLMREQIKQGNVVVVGETSSFLATIYILPEYLNDDYIYITYEDGQYKAMDSCNWEEMHQHYDEAKAESVKIWESEEDDE